MEMVLKDYDLLDNFEENFIKTLKLLKCVRTSRKVIFSIVKDLYYNHTSSHHGQIEMKPFLKTFDTNPKETLERMDRKFNFNFDVNKNQPKKYLDIKSSCTLYKVIRNDEKNALECFKETSNETLTKSLESIYEIRNYTFHLKPPAIDNLKDDIKTNLKTACEQMSEFCRKYNYETVSEGHYKNIDAVIQEIEDIWKADLSDCEHISLKEILQKDKDGLLQKLIEKFERDVSGIYKKVIRYPSQFMSNILPCSHFEEIYVPLSLHRSGKKVWVEEILESDKESAILFQGDAGVGKTTLSKKIVRDWLQKKSYISQYALVLLIEVKKVKENTLYKYTKEVLCSGPLNAKREDLYYFLSKIKVLIIIEGFDENSKGSESIISDLKDVFSNGTLKLIVTSRPSYVDKISKLLKDQGLNFANVKLEGFNDKNVYIDKVWDNLKKNPKFSLKKKNFTKFLGNLSQEFKKLTSVPFIMMMLICLWVKKDGKSKSFKALNFTRLYDEILTIQKDSILERINLQHFKDETTDCQRKNVIDISINLIAEALFEKCVGTTSIEMLDIDDALVLTVKRRLPKKQQYDEYINIVFETLFKSKVYCRPVKENSPVTYHYEFIHKTQFEFLTAYHAASIMASEKSLKSLKIYDINKLGNCLEGFSFLIGLLAVKNQVNLHVGELSGILKRYNSPCISNFNILWKILRETVAEENSHPNADLCNSLKTMFDKSTTWKLDEGSVANALNILLHVPFNPDAISIEISKEVTDPSDIPEFLIKFNEVMKALKKRQRKGSKVNLKMYFLNFKHYTSDKIKEVDNFLDISQSECIELKRFEGFLTGKGISYLKNHANITHLSVMVVSPSELRQLDEIWSTLEKVEKVELFFNEPFPLNRIGEVEKLRDINGKGVSISQTVNYLDVKDEEALIKNLKKLQPRKSKFKAVSFRMELNPETSNLVEQLGEIVEEDVFITSDYLIEEHQLKHLQESVKYRLRWK